MVKINLIKKDTKEILSTSSYNIEFGTSSDMASFALTAATIEMAIRNSKLTFDTNGLHIINGGFDITNENKSNKFYESR